MNILDYLVVLVTCPQDLSKEIAKKILAKRLVACVNVIEPIQSLYWWKDNLETDFESMLILKTQRVLFEALQEFILSIHPYDNPEIIALPIAHGAPMYLEWLRQETQKAVKS
ncbi:MAG: divalent-cation tolerance protein CutA [Candidatus Thorarchaeota archaeon]